jgi:hypothetical protein
MSRPLRLEFAGALYHITSRGNGTGGRSCILHVSLFKLCLFYSYLVYEIYNA